MKAYSLDLRGRVIEAYERKEGSIRKLAARFELHWRTVANWVRRYKTEHAIEPRKQQHGPKPILNEERIETLKNICKEAPLSIQQEITDQLKARLDIQIDRRTVGRAIRKLGFRRKKVKISQ